MMLILVLLWFFRFFCNAMSSDGDSDSSFDDYTSSESDPLFDERLEEDQGEPEDVEYDKFLDQLEQFEFMAETAPPIADQQQCEPDGSVAAATAAVGVHCNPEPDNDHGNNAVVLHNAAAAAAVSQNAASQNVGGSLSQNSSKKTGKRGRPGKARGPSRGLKPSEPMYLEYDDRGQPCGKWRDAYGKHVGVCMKKCSILLQWDEVEDGLKTAMWQDTMVITLIRLIKLYCVIDVSLWLLFYSWVLSN